MHSNRITMAIKYWISVSMHAQSHVARYYGIDSTLPSALQEAQDIAYAKQARKRKLPGVKSATEKEAEKRARKEESMLQKARIKEEKERQREERRKQASIKYPIEDLDIPIYRKDPNANWTLIDMTSGVYTGPHNIPYPSGGRTPRPVPHKNTLADDLFESVISIWSFLTVFSDPLELDPFSIDEFERALCGTTKSSLIINSNISLLNVIIAERKQGIASDIASGVAMEDYVDEGPESKDASFARLRGSQVERGWRDQEQLRLAEDWDEEELEDPKGWELVLIGFLNDVATPELVPELDHILRHLVPRNNSTASEREKQYISLNLRHKLVVFAFLIDVVNESNLIKEYMEECQEQLTEFRRQKVELNKESKNM